MKLEVETIYDYYSENSCNALVSILEVDFDEKPIRH